MDSKNLKYFVAVAQYGSMNQAARAMFISQPQLSHIIKGIEDEVGFALLQRTSQGSRLTREGEEFLSYCKVLLQDMDSLDRFVNQVHKDGCRLSVSMTRFSHTAECFHEIAARFEHRDNLTLRLQECSTMDVIDDVFNGHAVLGVIHFSIREADIIRRNLENKKIQLRPLGDFRPYVSISSHHPLLKDNPEGELDAHRLLDYGVVRYSGQYEDFLYHIAMENDIVDLNESRKICYVNDRMAQMRLISVTDFYTIGIPEFNNQLQLFDVAAVPLKNCTEQLRFGVISKKGLRPSEIEREFIRALEENFKTL